MRRSWSTTSRSRRRIEVSALGQLRQTGADPLAREPQLAGGFQPFGDDDLHARRRLLARSALMFLHFLPYESITGRISALEMEPGRPYGGPRRLVHRHLGLVAGVRFPRPSWNMTVLGETSLRDNKRLHFAFAGPLKWAAIDWLWNFTIECLNAVPRGTLPIRDRDQIDGVNLEK